MADKNKSCEGSENCCNCDCFDCYYNEEVKVDYGSLEFAQTEGDIPVYEGTKRVA